MERDDLKIDIAYRLDLADLVNIFSKTRLFTSVGKDTRAQFEKFTSQLVKEDGLRNDVMHSVRSVLNNKRDVYKLWDQVQGLIQMLQTGQNNNSA